MAPVDPLQRDRIVEVAGVNRIDRHDHAVGEIPPSGRHLFPESLRLAAGLGERPLGKRAGQGKLMDHRERVDSGLAGGPEHLDDHALTLAEVRWESHHLHDHLVVLANPLGTGIADRHRSGKIRTVNSHPAAAGRLEIAAHEAGGAARDDLHDLTRRPGATDIASPGEPHADGVPRGGIEGGGRRDVNVTRTVAGGCLQRPDKSVAPGRTPEDANHVVPLRFTASASRRFRRGCTARSAGRLPRVTIARWAEPAHETPATPFQADGVSRAP